MTSGLKPAIPLLFLFAPSLFAGSQSVGAHAAVATSSRYATQTALEVLRRGGNAADAAVAAAFVLAVVSSKSAGLGGGGTLVYYDARSAAVWTLDFRERAPAALAGVPPRAGIAGVAVPTMVAGMDEFHRRFASQAWKTLLDPASRAADGDLAKTLEQLASSGARAFYDGPFAARMVDEVRKAGGVLSLHDLSGYKPAWRAPIDVAVGDDEIITVGPPSAGGMMIAEMLSISGATDVTAGDAAAIHRLAEAERRAAFDRDKFFADNAAFGYRELLSPEHARQWRASIEGARATPTISLGQPASAMTQEAHETHFTIVDPAGNIAAVTLCLDAGEQYPFVVPGSGFTLNNAARNATRAGDRIPSSMSPAIVLRKGKPMLAIGGGGGAMIPAIVLQVILGVTRSGKNLNAAIEAPRFDQQAVPEDITYEKPRTEPAIVTRLTAMGHGMRAVDSIGNVNAVLIEPGRLTAVADSRGGGIAGAM